MKKFYFLFWLNLCIASFFSCSLQYQKSNESETLVPQIIFSDLSLIRYKNSTPEVTLTSTVFEQYKGNGISYAKDVAFSMFDSDKKEYSKGNANFLRVDSKNNEYTLLDGLEFTELNENFVIKGKNLKWIQNNEQLVSGKNDLVSISKDDFFVTGKGFSASAVSNSFLFSNNVSGYQILVSQSENETERASSENANSSRDSAGVSVDSTASSSASNSDSERIIFSGNSMQGKVSTNSNESTSSENSTVLSGNAIVETSKMTIKSDVIELCGKDFKTIKADGNISGTNYESEITFTADSLEYDSDTKIVILKGNVELKDLKNDVVAKAQVIEYDQNKDIAVMQIDVELTQKENVCKAAFCIYNKEKQTLQLTGNASVKQKDDVFRAQMINFNMETEEIKMDGNIRGSVTSGE